jgi:hypothetical protein
MRIHRLFKFSSDPDDSYIRLATQIYGIIIHIHENNSINTFQVEYDCPIIHLIKMKLKNGSAVHLATEKIDEKNEMSDVYNDDMQLLNHVCHEMKYMIV